MKVLRLRIEAEIPLPDDAVEMADAVRAISDESQNFGDILRREYSTAPAIKLDLRERRKPKVAPASATRNPPADTRPVQFETLGDPGEVPEIMRRT